MLYGVLAGSLSVECSCPTRFSSSYQSPSTDRGGVARHSRPNGEPAIGITADFGEGKSSVLHLIRDSFNRGERAIAVPFRTWLPGTEEAFVDSLFGTATGRGPFEIFPSRVAVDI
jgi:hypothetical protein